MRKGLTGATGNLYCGLWEFEDMGFLLHFLRSSDLFIDIGANVGVYTVLAAGEVGARTIAIEPIPATFAYLLQNISINEIQDRVTAQNIGLGAEQGTVRFTESLDTVNHVATAGEPNTIEVAVNKLDAIARDKPPALLKIDVEGFETEVINGGEETLRSPRLKAVIIELNGCGERYGYDDASIHQQLLNHGFQPYRYAPRSRQLHPLDTYGDRNTIYLRDVDFVRDRVKSSRKIRIGNGRQYI